MSSVKKLASETAIYGLSSIFGRFLNFLLTPFYTKIVFANNLPGFGIVTELYSYVVFLLIFLTFGMETGYFRFVKEEKHGETIFGTIMAFLVGSSSLFILLILLFLEPICGFLKYEQMPELIILLAIIVAFDAFSAVPFAKLRQQEKSKRFAILKLVNIGVNIGFNLLFYVVIPRYYYIESIKNIFDVENIVIYVFISNLIASIVTLLLLTPEIISEKFSFNKILLKKLLLYSVPLLLAGLAGQTNEFLDRILLKYFIPVPETITNPELVNQYILGQIGIYGANYKLAIIITLFIQAFRYSFEPMFFKAGKGNDKKELYAKIMNVFVIFCLIMFLMITLYIDIFKHFIGEKFRVGLVIVPVVLFSQILLGILFNLSVWYKLTDKTKYGLLIAGTGACVTVIFNIILIPKYSYVGAAWTHVICYSVMVILSYILSRKHFKVPYNLKRLLVYVIFALTLYAISEFIQLHSIVLELILNSILFALFIGVAIKKENILSIVKRK